MNLRTNILFIATLVSAILAGICSYFLPGLFSGSWLLLSLWGLIYIGFSFSSVDVNQWHSTKNILRIVFSLLSSFSLTTTLFILGCSGSPLFWKDPGNNSRHHFLIHEGFISHASQPLYLSGNIYQNVQAGLEGQISLTQTGSQFSLQCRNVPYPIYVSKQSDNNSWHLQQSGLPSARGKQTLFLQLDNAAHPEQLQVQTLLKEKNKFDFLITYNKVTDTISDKIIAYGIRFFDLLENTSLPLSYDLLQSLQQLYLLKTNIRFISSDNYDSPMYWFYGKDPTYQYWQTKLTLPQFSSLILSSSEGEYDLLELQYQDKSISLEDKDRFYFGYEPAAGKQFLQQPAFSVEKEDINNFKLKYLQPQVFRLPEGKGRNTEVFITSHHNLALQRAGYSGYILPAINFEGTDSNYNHFWCNLQYIVSPAGKPLQSIRFRLNELLSIQTDSSFIIYPSGNTGWILKIHNSWVEISKDKLNTLLPVILVVICCIVFIYLYSKKYSDEKNSGTPVFFWWMLNILLYFYLLRLFLSWRVRSFPYTDNISRNEYKDFIDKSYLKTSFSGISLSTNLLIAILICTALGIFLAIQFLKPSKR